MRESRRRRVPSAPSPPAWSSAVAEMSTSCRCSLHEQRSPHSCRPPAPRSHPAGSARARSWPWRAGRACARTSRSSVLASQTDQVTSEAEGQADHHRLHDDVGIHEHAPGERSCGRKRCRHRLARMDPHPVPLRPRLAAPPTRRRRGSRTVSGAVTPRLRPARRRAAGLPGPHGRREERSGRPMQGIRSISSGPHARKNLWTNTLN